MNPQERREKLLNLIRGNNGKIAMKEMAGKIEISQSALYKDINILENQRLIRKNYGTLELVQSEEKHHNFYLNMQKNAVQKKAIAKKAISLVMDNDTIFVDGSSTTFYFCEGLKKSHFRNITLITNSIFVQREMISAENINTICVGGTLNKLIGTSDGDIWESLVKDNFYANKFFFSCYSMPCEVGCLDPVQTDASMKAVFALKSQKNICLVDSSKFLLYGTFNWIGLDRIDIIISDKGIGNEIADKLVSKGIEVLIAG
jgi:DeoR/GlpR family transcriptional regulator of sugar metabolism